MVYLFLLVGVMFGFHLHSTDEHYRTELIANALKVNTDGGDHLIIVNDSEQLFYG